MKKDNRDYSKGKSIVRKWTYRETVYHARTRSEARAMIKRQLGLKSLTINHNELREVK